MHAKPLVALLSCAALAGCGRTYDVGDRDTRALVEAIRAANESPAAT
jgi:hypothetical protein